MSYRQDRRKIRGVIFKIVIILILLFLISQIFGFSKISNFFKGIYTPIWQTERAFSGEFLKITFTSKKDLLEQNEVLKSKLEEEKLRNNKIDILEEENKQLKEIFLRSDYDDDVILGTILSKAPNSPYGTLVIDIGRNEGVGVDNRVLAMGDTMIGEILSVSENNSNVILLTAPGNIFQVVIEDTGRYFNARGRGNGNFEIEVPRDLEIELGDIAYYPSIETHQVGVVKKIIFDPRDSFKTIILNSPINLNELKWIEVKI